MRLEVRKATKNSNLMSVLKQVSMVVFVFFLMNLISKFLNIDYFVLCYRCFFLLFCIRKPAEAKSLNQLRRELSYVGLYKLEAELSKLTYVED